MTDGDWATRWTSQWLSGAQRFNKNHAPAGSAGGGQFTTAGGGGGGAKSSVSKTAPKAKTAPVQKPAVPAKAKKLPAHQPNGLGYTAKEWARLQRLEAEHKAGKKLTKDELHDLHVAHMKHEAHLSAQAAAVKREAAAKAAAKKAPKAAAKAVSAPKATVPKKTPAAKKTPAVNSTNKYFAGHPVKGA